MWMIRTSTFDRNGVSVPVRSGLRPLRVCRVVVGRRLEGLVARSGNLVDSCAKLLRLPQHLSVRLRRNNPPRGSRSSASPEYCVELLCCLD